MANKSENKFSVGDKVERVGLSWMHVQKGSVYTVRAVHAGDEIYLEEIAGIYDAVYFKLVEQKEKEMTFKNMKFDVADIAKQLNVEHEEASRIIQEALFEQGYEWVAGYGKRVQDQAEKFLYLSSGEISYGNDHTRFEKRNDQQCTIKPTYTIVEAEEQQGVVELNGKKYNKQELEKALSLLKPIE